MNIPSQFVSFDKATTSDVVNASLLPANTFCVIGNYIFKSFGKNKVGNTILDCYAALKRADGRYKKGDHLLPVGNQPVIFLENEAAAKFLVEEEDGTIL